MEDSELWGHLGLGLLETRVYLRLLADPSLDRLHLRRVTGSSQRDLEEALALLVKQRLIRDTCGELLVVDPQVAITALARRRQSVLDEAALAAGELADLSRRARPRDDPQSLFDTVRGRDRIVARMLSLLGGASTSVDWTSTPPYLAGMDDEVDSAEIDLLGRGVRMRGVYDATVLESGAHMDNVQSMIDLGERARVVPAMRTKLLIFDSTTAMVPVVRVDESNEPIALVIRNSPLVEALQRLFDFYWQTGQPVKALRSDTAALRAGARDHRLLTLLSNGLSDIAIARQLDVSERTLRRRISTLQHQWSASSRFQLGMIAQRRGLVD